MCKTTIILNKRYHIGPDYEESRLDGALQVSVCSLYV